ncbi:MAG TPA: aminomethyl-transferring glycine dehydrogenase subunit GcvPB, partial [Burkholderiales bacterium]|nr:aminomethyl-transferring glycine dehydrogenase subunit GcvPB [Burkholderiales bacterium]
THPLIFESGSPGRSGFFWPEEKGRSRKKIPAELLRDDIPGFPELGELEVLRHFTRLSHLNYAIESQFYPLGSCTMKYNPKVNEVVARLPGFSLLHPLTPPELIQGALELLYGLEGMLAEISGMDHVTLQPSAGAQGELTGLMVVRACLRERGNPRKKIIVPDTAHGTNPASSTLCGYHVVQVPSNNRGMVDAGKVEEMMDEDVAALMLTNPNTLGLFEKNIRAIAEVVHKKGGLVYLDGANLNALMGIAKPGDMGVDVLHINLHKTFSTPHGGGGPGAGPVAANARLEPFLPVPIVGIKDGRFRWLAEKDRPQTIGRLSANMGNAGVLLRAYVYARLLGREGMHRVAEFSTLNANYLLARLTKAGFDAAYPKRRATHEFILTLKKLKDTKGVIAMDVAKRLLDKDFHAPTTYFPLLVPECFLIEPTETEAKEELDRFVDALAEILREIDTNPELVKTAPHTTPVRRLDDVRAARELDLTWKRA